MTEESRFSIFTWFCSALRNKKNKLAHFTNGLKGMGDYLVTKSRVEFFKIISGIVNQIKISGSAEEISNLFNCLYWEIKASDQELLVRTGIFELLKDGNSKSEPAKNLVK